MSKSILSRLIKMFERGHIKGLIQKLNSYDVKNNIVS